MNNNVLKSEKKKKKNGGNHIRQKINENYFPYN